MEMAPVNQRTLGGWNYVPSAVRPNEIEQRCRYAKVRTLQKVWSPEARNPFLVLWGRVIDKRARPEGASRAGEKSVGSARSNIRKRQRASLRTALMVADSSFAIRNEKKDLPVPFLCYRIMQISPWLPSLMIFESVSPNFFLASSGMCPSLACSPSFTSS